MSEMHGCSLVCDNQEDLVYYGLVRWPTACYSWVAWTGHTRFVMQCPEYSKQLATVYCKTVTQNTCHQHPMPFFLSSTLLVHS